ncbi:uncharacterized protein LOC120002475 [Tripterygium wilfordii]|uniref:uncharacterized protein LOC120002475 n=1 Tax=Tripterygium wilfordii TaxID=458696 RepID=UPI0018F7F241|nr:uncharacterized protein LOC120002475 [Tripterygium wilfordii]
MFHAVSYSMVPYYCPGLTFLTVHTNTLDSPPLCAPWFPYFSGSHLRKSLADIRSLPMSSGHQDQDTGFVDILPSFEGSSKVETPGATTGIILTLRESLQECKDNHATCQKLGLIDAVIEKMAKSNAGILRYREQIKQKLLNNLSSTPDHPAYAAMIHRAIAESKEDRGPSEEEISDFIRQEYKDTKFAAAHSSMLKIHLIKLYKKGEIVCTIENRYIFPDDSDSVAKLKQGKRQKCSHRNVRKHKAEKDDESREGMTDVHCLDQNAGHNHQIKELDDQNRPQEGIVAIFQGQSQEVNVGERHAGQPWMDTPMERDQAREQNVNGFGEYKLAGVSHVNQHETEVTEERNGVIAQGENQATGEKNVRRGLYEKGEGQVTGENHLMEASMSEKIKENDKPETERTEDVLEEIEVSVRETKVLEEHAEVIVEEQNQAKDQRNEPTSELCEGLMDQTTEEQHYLEEPLGGAIEEKDKRQTDGSEEIGDEVPVQQIEVVEEQMGLSRQERSPGNHNTPQYTKKQVESAATMISLPNSFLVTQNVKDSIPKITSMKSMYIGVLKRTKEIQRDLENVVDLLSMLDGSNTNYPQPEMEVAATGHLLKTLPASVDVLTDKMKLMQGKQCKPLDFESALEFTGACEKFSQKLKRQKQLCDQQMELRLNQTSIPTTAEEQSQPAEQQVEHKFRGKHLCPRVQGRVPHKEDVEPSMVERSLPLFHPQDQQQQAEGQFDGRQLQPQGPDLVQSDQPKPQQPRLGRPPKGKVMDMEEALPLNDYSHINVQSNHSGKQQPHYPRLGRPPKKKFTDLGESSPANDQNQIEELRLQKRGLGRPKKYKKTENAKCSLAESTTLHGKDNRQPRRGRGRPPNSRPEARTAVDA